MRGTFMRWFDSHVHLEGRSIEDLERMRELGLKAVMNCAFYPVPPEHPETFHDLFRRMLIFEVERGKDAGLQVHSALGIHPRCIPKDYQRALEWISEGDAVGEIGLEKGGKIEEEVFRAQLRVAEEEDLPCIIHTPKEGKVEITEKTLEILEELSFPESLVLVDHATQETAGKILKRGYHCGLSVQSGKLTPGEALEIVRKFGDERIVLNSDVGFARAQLDAVPRTAELIARELGRDVSEKVALKNAKKFFRV
ncbi:MAG: uncharacterized protein PWR09_636 [Archaeoglobi archaeon]|nr:uncharacterized protein [Archaeoglobi archaeon]